MMLAQKKNQGLVKGCLVPVLTVAGMLAVCFLACFVLFNLNQASISGSSSSFVLPFLFG